MSTISTFRALTGTSGRAALQISVMLMLAFTLLYSPDATAQITGQPGPGQNFAPGLGYRPKPLKRFGFDNGEGRFVRRTANEVYGGVAKIEERLYGKTYWEEPLNKRFRRIEKTLFGSPQKGYLENRLTRIEQELKLSKLPNGQYEHHKPMIEYLEKKLFQRTFDDWPITERIGQLESHVFGKSFYEYPIDVRIKKLTYTIPILAKEIRVAGGDGVVIATTQSRGPKTKSSTSSPAAGQPTPPTVEIAGTAATKTTPRPEPGNFSADTPDPIHSPSPTYSTPKPSLQTTTGQTILTGNYTANTYRTSQGQFLRWMNLPIKVFIKNGTTDEVAMVNDAITLWKRHFPIETVQSAYEADIFIDWKRNPASRTPITRPILHLDDSKSIRTVILIDMTPYKHLPKLPSGPDNSTLLKHGVLHQLGHACGLWGHSDNPHDVMYPINGLENHDIPKRWNRRSPRQSDLAMRGQHFLNDPKPSQRDFNTLTQIYSKQGMDLKSYSPYHR